MDLVKWQKIKMIFNEIVELQPVEQEKFFFRAQKETDAEILAEVRRLLAADAQNNFKEPIANLADIWPAHEEEEIEAESFVGHKIGSFTISREVGRGGMGIVFEAVRSTGGEDFSQIVALKLLKKGMDSEAMIRRFRHERQILASLEHPNIARFLDGGMTVDGTPFFAMEFVEGLSINDYCREKNLSTTDRLQLFRQVCAAVSFAHSRLVVHRDLKPSNIIVNRDGTVKLLDFGIAKILSPEGDLLTQTVTALGMMTPAFASPEQIKGELVSTSSDIYSLGLVLYEILTGVRPFQFPNNQPDEVAKIICEMEPPRPSSAVNSVVSGQRAVGSGKTRDQRSKTQDPRPETNPKSKIQNPKSLRGDLDNIILKALRKEPARRYASVEQFAGDISRHLAGLPVIARPDTFSYRFEKFVKRNRIYVMTAFLILLTLMVGMAATGWQAYRAEKQRKLAEERFNQVRALANNIVFKYYDEAEKLPNSTPLREMFVKDSLDYFDSLARDENSDVGLKTELGKTFLRIARVQGRPTSPNLGDTKGALENYRKGIEILEPLVLNSADAVLQGDLISAYTDYSVVLKQNGDFSASEKVFQKSISTGEVFFRLHPENEALAARLGLNYMFWGDSLPVGSGENENIAVYKRSQAIFESLLKDNPDDLRLNSYLAATQERTALALITLAKSARFDENPALEKQYLQSAKPLLERNVEIGEKMVRAYPNQILPPALLASAELNYGTLLIELEDYSKALKMIQNSEKFYRASMEMDKVSVGQKIEVSAIEQRLGVIYSRTGETPKSEALYTHAFELLDYLVNKDPENFDYIKIRGSAKFAYADELMRRGEVDKSRQTYEKAFREMQPMAQNKDSAFAASLEGLFYEKLGTCYLAESSEDKSNIEKAATEYKKAVEIWQKTGVLNMDGIRQNDKLAVLEKKIRQLQK